MFAHHQITTRSDDRSTAAGDAGIPNDHRTRADLGLTQRGGDVVAAFSHQEKIHQHRIRRAATLRFDVGERLHRLDAGVESFESNPLQGRDGGDCRLMVGFTIVDQPQEEITRGHGVR